jgi:ubiquitin C-terminal hydrolase
MPKGLSNLGNTCYMNSAIQCLSHIPELSNHLLKNAYDGPCEVTREYSKLIKDLWRNKEAMYIVPRDFHAAFTKKYPSFANLQPHDVQEVILKLIDTFEASLGKEFVRSVFNGKEVQEVTYPKGVSRKEHDVTTVVVTPTAQNQTLEELMERRDGLDAFSGYTDDDGNTWNAAVTRTIITKYPSTLVLSFSQYAAKYTVRVPRHYNGYSLFGLVVHYGSTYGGHYAAYVKHKGTWRYIDDDTVTESEPNEAGEYYLAFYKLLKDS